MKNQTPPSSTDYHPAADYVLIKPEKQPDHSEGGIFIPDQSRKTLNEGEIIECGPQVSDIFRKGMFVVFSPASEYRLELAPGEIVFAVSEPNIMLWREPKSSLFPTPSNIAGVQIPRCPEHDRVLPCPVCEGALNKGSREGGGAGTKSVLRVTPIR